MSDDRLLMDLVKGNVTPDEADALAKAKYKRRTGTPGHYKYEYDDPKPHPSSSAGQGTATGRLAGQTAKQIGDAFTAATGMPAKATIGSRTHVSAGTGGERREQIPVVRIESRAFEGGSLELTAQELRDTLGSM